MADTTHVEILRATQLDGEDAYLNAVVDDLFDEGKKLAYADWLEEQGDKKRATFLRKYAAAFQSMNAKDFPSLRGLPAEWTRMIGAKLVDAIAEHDVSDHRDEWLGISKPALIYKAKKKGRTSRKNPFPNDQTIPVGGTKLFGVPDLPPGSAWPRQKDCDVFYMEGSGIAPEMLCSFVCQINFADFAGTQAGRLIPDKGLLSIFSCSEIDTIGMVDALAIYTPDVDNLERMEPPMTLVDKKKEGWDEANALQDAQNLSFSETLEIPYPDDESPFDEVRYGWDDDLSDKLDDVKHQSDGGEQGDSFLGYTRATTGADPLPGRDYCKLICIENTIGIVLHFCIRNKDIAAGKFKNVKLAWVDFD
ncbi:MAG: hypothetical protein CMJ78_03795 [Planctomycetaceae bacterium]|nr:hypothetical protein [Planctomycetaceae bacterium]